jgi:hypothetical protein
MSTATTNKQRGRPRTFKHGVHVRLTKELIDYVHKTAKEYGLSQSEFISNCIRLYSPFAIIGKADEEKDSLPLPFDLW